MTSSLVTFNLYHPACLDFGPTLLGGSLLFLSYILVAVPTRLTSLFASHHRSSLLPRQCDIKCTCLWRQASADGIGEAPFGLLLVPSGSKYIFHLPVMGRLFHFTFSWMLLHTTEPSLGFQIPPMAGQGATCSNSPLSISLSSQLLFTLANKCPQQLEMRTSSGFSDPERPFCCFSGLACVLQGGPICYFTFYDFSYSWLPMIQQFQKGKFYRQCLRCKLSTMRSVTKSPIILPVWICSLSTWGCFITTLL